MYGHVPRLPWITDEASDELIGNLVLTTGEIVAWDPLVRLRSAPPFARTVAPGSYPVWIGRACAGEPSDDHHAEIAYATIVFRDVPVAQWLPAVARGEPELTNLRATPGYPVDAGMGCFVDFATARVASEPNELLLERLEQAGYGDVYDGGRDHAIIQIANTAGGNLVVFRSGYGDGIYPSIWGVDAGGAAVVLVTDFMVLGDGPGPSNAPT